MQVRAADGSSVVGTLTGDAQGATVQYSHRERDYEIHLDHSQAHEMLKPLFADPSRREWFTKDPNGGWQRASLGDIAFDVKALDMPTGAQMEIAYKRTSWSFEKGGTFRPTKVLTDVSADAKITSAAPVPTMASRLPEGAGLNQYGSLSLLGVQPFAVDVIAEEGDVLVVTPSRNLDAGKKIPFFRVPRSALGRLSAQEWEALRNKPALEMQMPGYQNFLKVSRRRPMGFAGEIDMPTAPSRARKLDALRIDAKLFARQGERSGFSVIIPGVEGQAIERAAKVVDRDGRLFLEYPKGGGTVSVAVPPERESEVRRLAFARDKRFSLPESNSERVNSELQSVVFEMGNDGALAKVHTEHRVGYHDWQKEKDRTYTRWASAGDVQHAFAEPAEGNQTRAPETQRWVVPFNANASVPVIITHREGDMVRVVLAADANGSGAAVTEYELPLKSLRFIGTPAEYASLRVPSLDAQRKGLEGLPGQRFEIPDSVRARADARWRYISTGEGRVRAASGDHPAKGLAINVKTPTGDKRGWVKLEGGRTVVTLEGGKKITLTGGMEKTLAPQLAQPGETRWAVPIDGGRENMEQSGLALVVDGELAPRSLHVEYSRRQWSPQEKAFRPEPFRVVVGTGDDVEIKPAIAHDAKKNVVLSLQDRSAGGARPLAVKILATNGTHAVVVRPFDIERYTTRGPMSAYAEQMLVPLAALREVDETEHTRLAALDHDQNRPASYAGFNEAFLGDAPNEGPVEAHSSGTRRPGVLEPAAAMQRLQTSAALKLLESESAGQPSYNILYVDKNGQQQVAEATVRQVAPDTWSASYTDAGGRRNTIRLDEGTAREVQRLVSGKDGLNAVPAHPAGFVNGRIRRVALTVDATGAVQEIRAQHDFTIYDRGAPGPYGAEHPLRAWADAKDVRGAFSIPVGRSPEAQRLVVVHGARQREQLVSPVVALKREGGKIKVALVADWLAWKRGEKPSVEMFSVDEAALRFIPNHTEWQGLVDTKLDRANAVRLLGASDTIVPTGNGCEFRAL